MTTASTTPDIAAPTVPKANRYAYIDALRGAFALFVVMHHSAMNPLRDPETAPLYARWLTFGSAAVAGFLAVSGYSLAIRIFPIDRQPGFRTFFERRLLRILPAYYPALFASLLLGATLLRSPNNSHWDASLPITLKSVILHLFLLHNFVGDTAFKIDYPMWSIATEFQVYLLLPLFVAFYRRWSLNAAFGICSVIAVLPLFLTHPDNALSGSTRGFLHFAIFFLLGIGARAGEKFRPLVRVAPVAAIASMLIGVAGAYWHFGRFQTVWEFFWAVSTAASLVWFANRPQARDDRKRFTPVLWLGEISYSLYLIHAPIVELVWRFGVSRLHLRQALTVPLIVVIGTLASVGVAYGFFLLFERPFLRRSIRETIPSAKSLHKATPE